MGGSFAGRHALLRRRALAGVVWVSAALMASGCWDRHELSTLAIATAVALDESPSGPGVLLTGEFAIPSRIAGAPAGGGVGMGGRGGGAAGIFARTASGPQGPTEWIVGAPGRTLGQAVERITLLSPRLPVWAQARVLILGEQLARTGLGSVLDGITRDRDFRRTVWVAVAKGLPAYRILELPSPLSTAASESLARLEETVAFRTALALPQRLHQLVEDYVEPGIDPVLPAVTVAYPVPPDPSLTPGETTGRPGLVTLQGSAIFRKGRLAGWLTPEQTRDLVMLRGLSRQFNLVTPCPQGKGFVSVNVLRFTTKRTMLLPKQDKQGGGQRGGPPAALPRFGVQVLLEGNLFEQTCSPPLGIRGLRQVEQALARQVEAEIRQTLRRLHGELRADSAGFGREIYRSQPALWKQLSPHWRSLLPRLQVNVKARLRIRRMGVITGEVEPTR